MPEPVHRRLPEDVAEAASAAFALEAVLYRDLKRRHDGNIQHIADELGLNRNRVRERLQAHGLYEVRAHGMQVKDLLPHEIQGLSPLNCGQCGAEAIGDHPCPECGWDPRE